MAESRPTGMRIPRPYKTEEDFIRGDGLTIGRMGMILLGAPPRAPGIIVRFEIVLTDGTPVFRGEGKVVAHRVHANGRKGLEVKFTKLDSHSKSVVERALELRRSGALTPHPAIPDLTPGQVPSDNAQAAVTIHHAETKTAEASTEQADASKLALSFPDAPPLPPGTQPLAPSASSPSIEVRQASEQEEGEAVEATAAPTAQENSPLQAPVPSPQPVSPPEAVVLPESTVAIDSAAEESAADELAEQETELLRSEPESAPQPEPAASETAPSESRSVEHEVSEESPQVDEDPTPFAPPVAFDDHAEAPAAEQHEPARLAHEAPPDETHGQIEEQPAQVQTEEEQPAQVQTEEEQPAQVQTEEEQPAQVQTEEEEQPAQVQAEEEQPAQVQAEEEQPAQVHQFSGNRTIELERLRSRRTVVEPPSERDSLLDRLRSRSRRV